MIRRPRGDGQQPAQHLPDGPLEAAGDQPCPQLDGAAPRAEVGHVGAQRVVEEPGRVEVVAGSDRQEAWPAPWPPSLSRIERPVGDALQPGQDLEPHVGEVEVGHRGLPLLDGPPVLERELARLLLLQANDPADGSAIRAPSRAPGR